VTGGQIPVAEWATTQASSTCCSWAALVLVLLTGAGIGRRNPGKPAEGQRTATIGMLIWLGLLGLACYLIFG